MNKNLIQDLNCVYWLAGLNPKLGQQIGNKKITYIIIGCFQKQNLLECLNSWNKIAPMQIY